MRRAWTLFVFILAVFGFAALLSPWIYWGAQALARGFPALHSLADHSFPRFVSRTLLGLALLGLWPLLRIMGKLSWRELGFVPAAEWRANLTRGFIVGFATLGVFLFLAFVLDARAWRGEFSFAKLFGAASLAFAAAVIVAPLEELIFRGVLFGSLRSGGGSKSEVEHGSPDPQRPGAEQRAAGQETRAPRKYPAAHRWLLALVLSSAVFALVHFIHTPRTRGPVTWTSGFEVLGAMFGGMNSARGIAQCVNLFICGALLAWAFQRTGTLYFSIGLHAGWIFWLKIGNALTTTSAAQQSFWGTRKVIDGWAATILLLSITAILPRLWRKPTTSVSNVAHASNQTQTVG